MENSSNINIKDNKELCKLFTDMITSLFLINKKKSLVVASSQ